MSDGGKRPGWTFEPGTQVAPGRTAVRRLGGGDRYEAWLGWDDHLCSPVVLKFLRPSQVTIERARTAIAREQRMLSSLAHPGIVRCFGADLDAEAPFLVLEFLDGPRLSTLFRKFGPLAPEQLVPLALEISSALGYMHNERVLHLDVKPQNLIMGAPPRLIDLSIARQFAEVGGITAPLGTAAYMAPEQADPGRLGNIGPWTDVWGLGVTLYEAVNGFRPFARSEDAGFVAQLSARPRPHHERVPLAVAEVITACLRFDPPDRPTLAEVRQRFEDMSVGARELAQRRIRRRVR